MKWSNVFLNAVSLEASKQSAWFTVLLLVLFLLVLTVILAIAGRYIRNKTKE